ncbi:hypothetical protein GGF50DRAFT_86626 [Schizophyllum commune]
MSSTQALITSVQAHITANRQYWHVRSMDKDALGKVVTACHFVAHDNHMNATQAGIPPTNHWSIYLELDDHTSVRLEVSPLGPSVPGMVLAASKRYEVTTNTPHVVSARAPAGLLVANVLRILIDKGRDRYIFDAYGQGCRMWVLTLAYDLAEARILRSSDTKKLSDSIQLYWPVPHGTAPYPRNLEHGTFF